MPLLDGKSEKYIIKKLKQLNITLEKIDLYLSRLEGDTSMSHARSASSPNVHGIPERKRMRLDELQTPQPHHVFMPDFGL